MNEETNKAKIEEIEMSIKELEINANRELAFLNGQLVALRGLLQPQEETKDQTKLE